MPRRSLDWLGRFERGLQLAAPPRPRAGSGLGLSFWPWAALSGRRPVRPWRRRLPFSAAVCSLGRCVFSAAREALLPTAGDWMLYFPTSLPSAGGSRRAAPRSSRRRYALAVRGRMSRAVQ